MADTPDFSLMKQQIEEIKALAYDLGVRIRRQWWNDARGSVRETPDAVQLSGMQMTNTPDLDSLRAIMAKRTPGEWRRVHNAVVGNIVRGQKHEKIREGAIVEISDDKGRWAADMVADLDAIVAAVNAIGPLLERVEKLEERRKSALARYGKALAENANMEATFEREATIANNNIQTLEAENKRLLERVRELEEHAHEIESENGSLLRQLAAANERIAELEAKLQTQMGAFCEAIKECERLEAELDRKGG